MRTRIRESVFYLCVSRVVPRAAQPLPLQMFSKKPNGFATLLDDIERSEPYALNPGVKKEQ